MIVALAIDDKGGMMFNKRRQSRDKALIADLAIRSEEYGNGMIYTNEYSEPLFEDAGVSAVSVPDPLSAAGDDATVFIENLDATPYLNRIDRLIIYKWNRRYPADVKLGFDPIKVGFRLDESYDFKGMAHEKITGEVYVK